MKLNDALRMVAQQLELNGDALITYAEEDYLPGSVDVPGEEGKLPNAIPYTADGKFLYALVRALKPKHILESGTLHGGSAAHLALALANNNSESMTFDGYIVTVDISSEADLAGVPPDLLTYIISIRETNIMDYVKRDVPNFEFIHEDASHEMHTVHAVYNALPRLMPFGGVIVSHDTNSGMRPYIMAGIKEAGFEQPPDYLYDESPCGFSVMRYKGVRDE